jgi:hypothetical protein
VKDPLTNNIEWQGWLQTWVSIYGEEISKTWEYGLPDLAIFQHNGVIWDAYPPLPLGINIYSLELVGVVIYRKYGLGIGGTHKAFLNFSNLYIFVPKRCIGVLINSNYHTYAFCITVGVHISWKMFSFKNL